MFPTIRCVALILLTLCAARAQAPADSDPVERVGAGVTAPRLVRKVEPEYSAAARSAHVQGTVMLQIIVDQSGRPTEITLLSPLGFGLDERAIAAVEKWGFAPGMKAGHPVRVLAQIEVNFRFPSIWFDEKAERRRTSFNLALQTLKRPDATPASVDTAVKTMQDLARQNSPDAMYLVGQWEIKGERIPQNAAHGLDLLQRSAAKNYGPALYEIGLRHIDGRDLPRNESEGLEELRSAAALGSGPAQFYLAARYQKGDGVPVDADRARRYYRLCAVQGFAMCQYRLGLMLLEPARRPERDFIQAVALFQLAADQGLAEARDRADREGSELNLAQQSWVKSLKNQLVRR